MMHSTGEIFCQNRSDVVRVMTEQAKNNLDDIYIHPITLGLSKFLFVDSTPYLDTYALFSVQQMHIFHLGLSSISKEASLERLRSITQTTDNYRAVKQTTCTLVFLLTAILRQVTKFVEEFSRYSKRTQTGLYIRNSEEDAKN